MESFEDFSKRVRKLNSTRKHKINNSYGIKDGFKYYRKTKPKDPKYILTDCQYLLINREINNILSNELINGKEVVFPYKLGKLEIRKFETIKTIKDGKLKLSIAIDWDKTIKLWYNDNESYTNKTLIRVPDNISYKVYYNKYGANYTNSTLYQFNVNRLIKRGLVSKIREGKIEAFDLIKRK